MADPTFPCRKCGVDVTQSNCAPSVWRQAVESGGRSRPACKPCISAYARHRYATDPDYRAAAKRRARYRPKRTGATIDCRICGESFQRTTAAETCSDECSLELKRERYRRKNRRRRMKTTPGSYTLAEIAKRDGCRCHLCGKRVNLDLSGMAKWGPTIDHLVPLSNGGLDVPGNVALAHRHCNVARGNRGEVQLKLMG